MLKDRGRVLRSLPRKLANNLSISRNFEKKEEEKLKLKKICTRGS